MRRTEPIRLGDLLKNLVDNNPRLSRMFLEARAIEAWKNIDPYIASQTTRANIIGGKLNVWIVSSALRQEIFMRRTELVARVNEAVGQKVITALYVK